MEKIATIKVTGSDAARFLQGQLTINIEDLIAGASQLAAHCNPQGRVISLFNIFLYDNDYYLLMPENLMSIALTALKKYAVFFKVVLTTTECGLDIIPKDMHTALPEAQIHLGIPHIYPETSGKFLPHELNLHELNALSFNKGCYTGQEIIARMHYRGKLKKHLYKTIVQCAQQPLPNTDVFFQFENELSVGGIIVDSALQIADNSSQDIYLALLLCEDIHVKQEFLFIEQPNRTYFKFLEQAKE